MTPPPPPQTRRRSVIVTLLAWVMMVTGVVGLPISFITALMFITKSYGTANAGFIDSCVVILGPFVVICAGFGLWRRWWWGLTGTLAVVVILMVVQAGQLMEGPAEGFIYISKTGEKTRMGAVPNLHSWPILLLCAGTLVKLLTRGVRREFSSDASAPPVQPGTAHDFGIAPPSTHTIPPVPRLVHGPATAKQRAALLAVIIILLGIAGGMSWLVVRGLQRGETAMPSRRASLQRAILQQEEPTSYWAALSVYTLIGLGSGAAALWATREAWHLRRQEV